MPLFMDRHDLPGVSAEQVAEFHVLDLPVAARHGVQFLTYWFDAAAGAAFCLARAASAAELAAVHRESHGMVPNSIIEVAENDVLRFLGRIEEPADHTQVTSPFRAVMFTDLEGSTALLNRLGQTAYLAFLTEHDVLIRRALVEWRGREVKHTGDGIMAAFDDVPAALAAASAIMGGLHERNAATDGPAMRVRIGIAAGEPVDRDRDLFGSTVNLASRLCQAADGGQILVSEAVRDLGLAAGFHFVGAGRRVLKGFPAPIAAFALRREREPASEGPRRT